jgi:hypothetical protein
LCSNYCVSVLYYVIAKLRSIDRHQLIESSLLLNPEFKNINSAYETLNNIDSHYYPIFTSFIKILVTLPISVATAERSFSSLRLLKTWLRARMTEERLTGLALMIDFLKKKKENSILCCKNVDIFYLYYQYNYVHL